MSDTTSISSVLSATTTRPDTAAAPELKIVEIPESLQKVERRKTVRGEVIRTDNDGTVRIKTDKGEIEAKSDRPINLKQGDAVEIRIEKGVPPQSLNIKQAHKTPKATAPINQTQVTNITLPPILNAEQLINAPTLTVQPLQSQTQFAQSFTVPINAHLPKTIINTLPLPSLPQITSQIEALTAQPPQTPPPLQAILTTPSISESIAPHLITTSNISLKTPNTEIPLSFIVAQLIKSPAQAPITTPKEILNTAPTARERAPAQTQIQTLKVTDIALPENLNTFIAPKSSDIPQQTQARAQDTQTELVGFTRDREFPILKITSPEHRSGERYVLQSPVADLPAGAQIQVQILETVPIQQTQVTTSVSFPPLTPQYLITPEPWAILQNIQQSLTQVSPPIAQTFTANLPNASTPSQLAPAALFFLAAMKSGDLQNWLGDKIIETLKRTDKGSLITRLGQELNGIARLNTESANQEWRVLSLPLAWQNEIQKVVTYYKKEESAHNTEDENNNGGKTRFVMDLNLSVIGKLQLDGLYQDQADQKRLDLILRSEQTFSQAMKQEMRILYKNAMDETEITGELSFLGQDESWVFITPDFDQEFEQDI